MNHCRHLFWRILEFVNLHLQALALMLNLAPLLPNRLYLLCQLRLLSVRPLSKSLQLLLEVSDPTLKSPDLLALSVALAPNFTHVKLRLGLECVKLLLLEF